MNIRNAQERDFAWSIPNRGKLETHKPEHTLTASGESNYFIRKVMLQCYCYCFQRISLIKGDLPVGILTSCTHKCICFRIYNGASVEEVYVAGISPELPHALN